jgi:hypothetical protein
MSADLEAAPDLKAGIPSMLFQTRMAVTSTRDQYAVSTDGQRFLMITPAADPAPAAITVVLNWTAGLQR